MHEEILDRARELVSALDGLHQGVAEAAGASWFPVVDARAHLRRALQDEYLGRTHTSVAEVVRWMAANPYRDTETFLVGDGTLSYLSDGHVLLVASNVADVPPRCDFRGHEMTVARAANPVDTAKAAHRAWKTPGGVIMAAAVLEDCANARYLRCGAALIDANLVRAWVVPVARVDYSNVEIAWAGPWDAVTFAGAGWTAYVMPLNPETTGPHDGEAVAL